MPSGLAEFAEETPWFARRVRSSDLETITFFRVIQATAYPVHGILSSPHTTVPGVWDLWHHPVLGEGGPFPLWSWGGCLKHTVQSNPAASTIHPLRPSKKWYQHRPQTVQVNQLNQNTLTTTLLVGSFCDAQSKINTKTSWRHEEDVYNVDHTHKARSAPNPAQRAHQSQTPRPTQLSAPSTAKSHSQPSPARLGEPNPRPTQHGAPTSVSSLFFFLR